MIFQDRQGQNLNRKKMTIISQTPTEMIVDVERYDEATVEGTQINAQVFNTFQGEIDTAITNASTALTQADNAVSTAKQANTKADNAVATANTANSKSDNAVSTAKQANTKADNAVTTANSANTKADNAVTTANTASSNATSAVTTANSAITKADNAVTTANTASTNASSAVTTANSASQNASTALTNSQQAIADATSALNKSLEVEAALADRGATVLVNNVAQASVSFTSDPQAQINSINTQLGSLQSSVLSAAYPVGAIYMSVNSIDPSTLFGGSWEQIQDRFLLSAGSSYTAGATGGEANHTLTTSEMPSHTHAFTGTASNTGNTQPTFTGNAMTGSITRIAGKGYDCTGVFSVSDNSDTYGKGGTYSTAMKKLSFNGTPSGTVSSHNHSFTPSGSNSTTGSGSAHNNMPPYLVVYMWKRTA